MDCHVFDPFAIEAIALLGVGTAVPLMGRWSTRRSLSAGPPLPSGDGLPEKTLCRMMVGMIL
jgi:hypothetical protein